MHQATVSAHLPVGICALSASINGLTAVRLGERVEEEKGPQEAQRILERAVDQLQAYFAGELQDFDLPLDLTGRTEFQRRVLQACSQVPYGRIASYSEIAARAGSPLAARAVGQVMAQNRLALVIPCHRVVGSSGHLVGYGYGLAVKERLLRMEREGSSWQNGPPPLMLENTP